MTTFILIIILSIPTQGYYQKHAVTLQEFNTMTQCQYAAKIIRENTERLKMAACINK